MVSVQVTSVSYVGKTQSIKTAIVYSNTNLDQEIKTKDSSRKIKDYTDHEVIR